MGLHDATVSGTPVYAAGKFGNAYNPNGGKMVVTGTIAASVGTIEAWASPSGTTKIRMIIGSDAGASQQWIGKAVDGTAAAGVGGTTLNTTIGINDSTFHHLALTLDGTNAKLYVDGVLAQTLATAATLNLPATTSIGAYGNSANNPWSGLIDEIRVSSTVRYTAAFTPPTTAFTSDSATLALFHLEADGTDSATNANPPTIGTISVATASGTDTITYPAPTAGTNAVAGVSLYVATASGTQSTTPVATNTGTGSGTFTQPTPTSGQKFYIVKAFDTATTPNYSTASNEVSTGTPLTTTTFAPNASGIYYSPYNWNVTSAAAKTINAGAYFRFAVSSSTATQFTLNFDVSAVSAPNPIIKYRINNGTWASSTLAASVTIAAPTTDAWTIRVVEVVVQATSEFVNRWTPQNASVTLTSIVVGGTTTATLNALQAGGQNILVLGDSIAEGYKTLNGNTTPDGSDATSGWAHLLNRLVGAEVGVVGFGGQGWTTAGQGGVPKLATSYTSVYSGINRSFTTPAPDVVIIEMGHNDGATDNSAVTSEATTVLNGLLAATPTTTKILVFRPFSGRQATPLLAAIAAIGNTRISYVDTSGWFTTTESSDAVHPYGSANITSIGPKAAAAVKAVLAGAAAPTTARRFINKGGVAVAI